MSNPDIQFFPASGTWVKPPGAVRVDIVLQGAGDGTFPPFAEFTAAHLGRRVNPNGIVASNGEFGDIRVSSWDAGDVDDTVRIEVGKGGRPGGRDGYALIVTHLADPPLPSVPVHDRILHAHPRDTPDDGEPHEHLHGGPGHLGFEHSHPHSHVPGEQ